MACKSSQLVGLLILFFIETFIEDLFPFREIFLGRTFEDFSTKKLFYFCTKILKTI